MFYPAQTSLIPVYVALARFLESQGWRAIFSNYPYWYLGTTPFRYLTGPVLPGLLVIIHKLLPGLNLFEIFFGLIGVMWVIGGIGVYWLVKELSGFSTSDKLPVSVVPRGVSSARWLAFSTAVFYLLGPIVPFLFRFSNGLSLISFSVVPWVLWCYVRFLRGPSQARKNPTSLARSRCLLGLMTLAILLDTSIIPTLFLGMTAIFLTVTDWRKSEERIKKTFLIFGFSFLISTLWYTPGYWWQVLIAPSFAGKSLFKVIGQVIQLLPAALAISLAIVSGKIAKTKLFAMPVLQDSFGMRYALFAIKFCFYWLFIFGFLSFLRFLSDPDFWLDWSSYGVELQMGIGIFGSLVVSKMSERLGRLGGLVKFVVCCLLFVVWLFAFDRYVLGTFQKNISQLVEYRLGRQLSEIARPGEKVFLSGTTAFWLNAFFDIPQVRGGNDPASVHPTWREAVWEMREGTDAKTAERWLKTLKISYLVVHTGESEEFWHDFTYPEKFEDMKGFRKIDDQNGDRIYQVVN